MEFNLLGYCGLVSFLLAFELDWPPQYSCLENPMDGGAWWAAVHGVAQSRTRLSDFTFTFHFHSLEKEMATHSSVLAWRIPGTREPAGLLSTGLHRVGHDWSDLAAAVAAAFHSQAWYPYKGLTHSATEKHMDYISSLLEKKMATHSSVLAWRIPGMAEPGGLPSMGSHRVGHDWSDLAKQK